MKQLLMAMMSSSEYCKDLGLLVMRLGLGLIFMRHGFPKLLGGVPEWQWLGDQMANLGITFWPILWGLAAACTESFGGVALFLGLGVRLAAPLMAFVMSVAVVMHITKGDPWGYISHPLALMVVFIGLFITGAGMYSLDHYLMQ